MLYALRCWLALIVVSFTVPGVLAAEPKRVLLLQSFGPQFVPWVFFTGQLREELSKSSPDKIDLYEASLEGARSQQPDEQEGPVEPGGWRQYRAQIALVCAVVLLQGALISGLLFEHKRRLRAEIQSRQRSAELAHVNRFSMAGELTATIAHEINQPLGAILANIEAAEILVKSPNPDLHEIGEILADVRRDDVRASEVIGRLRSLLKKVPFELKDIDLNDVAQDTVRFLSALATAREVELISITAAMPLPIRGDQIQLQQVIMNLIVNAMDAMSDMPGGARKVKVSTARDGDFACLSVSDVGPGIPVEKLRQVFEPFFTTKAQGMGMGLSIARTIVEAHGGQLSAGNLAGRGAVFHITLPLAELSQ